jgi:hypothetical protein
MSNAVGSLFSASGLRMLHSYVSAFIAPMILFFAISGSFQLFNLHQAHGDYTPSVVISAMAGIHKDQVFSLGSHRAPERPGGPQGDKSPPRGPQGGDERPQPGLSTLLLKILFLTEALALVATVLLGVWIGVTHPKRARSFWIVLAAGLILPVVLIVV